MCLFWPQNIVKIYLKGVLFQCATGMPLQLEVPSGSGCLEFSLKLDSWHCGRGWKITENINQLRVALQAAPSVRQCLAPAEEFFDGSQTLLSCVRAERLNHANTSSTPFCSFAEKTPKNSNMMSSGLSREAPQGSQVLPCHSDVPNCFCRCQCQQANT